MDSQLHVAEPSPTCPFRVEGVQYIPDSPCEDGFTLIFLHAMSLHKVANYLLASSTRIRDVWSIDNPSHGRSSVLNQKLLATPPYREYCKMMLLHDQEFTGSSKTRLNFTSLILLDAALLPPEFPTTSFLSNLFGKIASAKRDKWPTRAAAHENLAAHPAFKTWDPRALRLFVDCALRDSGSGSEVVLSCSRAQETGFYLSPAADYKARPVEIFAELIRADEIPIHAIVCLKDEYKGKALPSKELQIAQVKGTTRGSVQILDRGGHMFPQVEPALCADAIQRALASVVAENKKARL
ncbi:hypothetical protein GGX14DRAFT_452073 [Mycena pura]|uniref:AB hydrolase-1 domain-containing protein n=1 Tax=Mycena pura TaxID=153505 RepID=A0AAD6VKF7_9AGAR|nr:hypothetical protein GGX14DRAFT_452073 [Mycena pura]